MKRLISLFLVALISISFLFIVPASAVNGVGLWYDKLGNNVKITVKEIESPSPILLVGKYQNKKMVDSDSYPITHHKGTYTSPNITMDEGFEYRFFVWEDLTNVKPLFDCLLLSVATADGVGSTEDNAVKSVTIRENLYTGWYSSGSYFYYPDSGALKPTEYELVTSGLTVVYNNAVITDSEIESTFGSMEELLLEADVLTLIGYGTAPYSEIHITDYTYKVVESVIVEENCIKFPQFDYLELDSAMRGNANFTYNLYDEVGNVIELSSLKEYDVLNILVPCNKEIDTAGHLDIYVTRKVIEGEVTERLHSGEYVISGKKYFAETEILLGEEGKFFITIDGKIAWKYVNIDIGELGLITEIKPKTEETSTSYTLTLFTQEGFIDIPVAESVWFEEQYLYDEYKTADNGQDILFGTDSVFANALADAETEYEAQEKISKKFIAYRLNSNGEIRYFHIANSTLEEPFFSEMVQKDVYDAEENTFAGIDARNSLLIFAPLTQRNSGWNIDISELRVAEFFDLKDKSTGARYNGISFLKSSSCQEELCALFLTEEMIDVNVNPESTHIENMSVVESRGSMLDQDDNVVSSITVVQNGEYKMLRETYSEKAVEKSGLETGDIFLYKTDDNGDIIEVDIIYDSSSRQLSDYAQSKSIDNDNEAFVFGVVVRFGDRIVIASKVDEENGSAVMPVRFQLHPDLMRYSEKCAKYDEEYIWGAKIIPIYDIKETVKENAVYTVVARLDEYKRICDIVQIVLSSDSFNEWADINNFTNWKLTY